MPDMQELKAAAERWENSNGFCDSFPGECTDDVFLLAEFAVSLLSDAPVTAEHDLEAELQGVCMTLADELWRGGVITRGDEAVALHIESRIRPLFGLKPKEVSNG